MLEPLHKNIVGFIHIQHFIIKKLSMLVYTDNLGVVTTSIGNWEGR